MDFYHNENKLTCNDEIYTHLHTLNTLKINHYGNNLMMKNKTNSYLIETQKLEEIQFVFNVLEPLLRIERRFQDYKSCVITFIRKRLV